MSEDSAGAGAQPDTAPGDKRADPWRAAIGYLIGFAIASAMTAMSFWVARSGLFWQQGVAIGICVLAVAQMGIHLVFFLHLTTGPDNINNALAVAFGILIVTLVGFGSLWIMSNLNANMMPMGDMMNLQMQR